MLSCLLLLMTLPMCLCRCFLPLLLPLQLQMLLQFLLPSPVPSFPMNPPVASALGLHVFARCLLSLLSAPYPALVYASARASVFPLYLPLQLVMALPTHLPMPMFWSLFSPPALASTSALVVDFLLMPT